MKRNITLLTFIILALYCNSQEIFNRSIRWYPGLQVHQFNRCEHNYLWFDNAVFYSGNASIPSYSEVFELDSDNFEVAVDLHNCIYEEVEFATIEEIGATGIIESAILPVVNVEKASDQVFAVVNFIPLRYDTVTGSFQKLVEFDLEIKKTKRGKANLVSQIHAFASNSVLKEGIWLKFRISKAGVHVITYSDLVNAGIDAGSINPSKFRIFGNGAGIVPERNSFARYDDLIENRIYIHGTEDNSFDEGDYILFYAESPTKWVYNIFKQIFEHETNIYDDYTYYFLNIGQENGKRIEVVPYSAVEPNIVVQAFNDYYLHEQDLVNVTKSGKLWVGEEFNEVLGQTFSFTFPELISSEPVKMKIGYLVRSGVTSTFDIYCNNEYLEQIDLLSVNLSSPRFGHISSRNLEFYSGSGNIDLHINFNAPETSSFLWLDYIELNLMRDLVFKGGQLLFRNVKTVKPDNVTRFILSEVHDNVTIWEITDRFSVKQIESRMELNKLDFILSTDSLRQFIAWEPEGLISPEFLGLVENQNLHAIEPVDYVIVAPDLFYDAASELAKLHHQVDGLNSVIVSPEAIYNEFSSGAQDPSAIRDFVRMLYERGKVAGKPAYLLLFGDGSYDPKGRDGVFNNFIPAYESNESLLMTSSYVTDDFYGLLDSTEGYNAETGRVDIGIGRFPVSTVEQSWDAFNKVKTYMTDKPAIYGEWRNEICFIADDEDGNTHFSQAEQLVEIIDTSYKQYHPQKIYLDAFRQQQISGGARYPDVNEKILRAIDGGVLIMNYTGHGGELGWSDEKILDIPTINSMDNLHKLPLFITATCEFSRFDNPELVSAGELVFLNPEGGGIALLTTTRLAFSTANFSLNRNFYQSAFEPINGELPRLGDIVKITKAKSNGILQKNVVLLGDPALRLNYPQNKVTTSNITINSNSLVQDTLSSLSNVTVSGEITDHSGNIMNSFNGVLHIKVYDKPFIISTLANDDGSFEEPFLLQESLLFRGTASVVDGRFALSFVLPKDMDLNYGVGKIMYYASDSNSKTDGHGYYELIVGGTDEHAMADLTGPEIELFLNNYGFISGDIVPNYPQLLVNLNDISGINYLGTGIGHDIVLTIDNDKSASVTLNDAYIPYIDNYRSGTITYNLGGLSEGSHTLMVQAWDVYNNSSQSLINFTISELQGLGISNLYNFPNPVTDETEFRFTYNGNEGDVDVELRFYNLAGKSVGILKGAFYNSPENSMHIKWDGSNENGQRLEPGLYVYDVIITNSLGYISKASGKLVIVNLQ